MKVKFNIKFKAFVTAVNNVLNSGLQLTLKVFSQSVESRQQDSTGFKASSREFSEKSFTL